MFDDFLEELETSKMLIVEQTPTPFLDRYTENITKKIKQKPEEYQIYGRDKEIEDVIVALLRKNKNSPLLIGEAGVGKTAIVEGIALRILKNQVPEKLKGLTVRSLELSNLMTESDGGFIPKFKGILEEMVATYGENLLFIDEIHTIVGTGGHGSMLDAGNMLKPPLARGEIQLIGATTIEEYHESIEQDKALERRFQIIQVEEPSIEGAITILYGAKGKFESFHQVNIVQSAIEQAVKLSERYLPERFLPDKAFDLLDEASTIASATGKSKVTEVEIAQVLKRRTGIPVTTILKDEATRLCNVAQRIRQRVKGQDFAVQSVADAISIAKAGLQDEDKPLASFLFLGTTGVGKTELAKSLAEVLFDSEKAMIRLDMSEYSLQGSSIKLIGDGKHQKGILTEAVKHQPYSIVLFDEIEKGDREVHDLLLQILDDGRLTDAKGRLVNFKNTIIIMTTNIGAEKIKINVELKGDVAKLSDRAFQQFIESMDIELQTEFRPEFINRIEHKIIFQMLDKPVIQKIAQKQLSLVEKRIQRQGATFSYDAALLDYLADLGTDSKNGARPLQRLINRRVVAPIAEQLVLMNPKEESWHFHLYIEGMAPVEDELIDKRQIRVEITKNIKSKVSKNVSNE